MAIRAFLTSISPEIYQTIKLSGGFIPSNEILGTEYDWQEFVRVGIDTAWDTLHSVFSKAGCPLVYALEGDYHPEGGLQFFTHTADRTSYLAYVSPDHVKAVAEALTTFSIKEELLKFEKDTQYLNYCLVYFNDLISLYQETARKGEAIFISIN